MADNSPETVDAELAALLMPSSDVADTEGIDTSQGEGRESDAATIAVLQDSWAERRTLDNGDTCGKRVRIPRIFHNPDGKRDLATWQRGEANAIYRLAQGLGFTTRTSGAGQGKLLGWRPLIHKGEHVQVNGGKAYLLFTVAYKRAPRPTVDANAPSSVPNVAAVKS